MLLCLSRGRMMFRWPQFWGAGRCSDWVIAGWRTRQGWAPGMGRKLLLGHAQQVREMRPGTADESFEGQQVRGSRILGQAVPGECGSVGGRAQVGVYLAGDVALQAA